MALQAIINKENVYKIILEEYPEGVYVLVYACAGDDDQSPSQDHLQDNWDMAKRSARERYGVLDDQWEEIPDTFFNG
jgi:hypothetical protein